jgi:hypothetical protein
VARAEELALAAVSYQPLASPLTALDREGIRPGIASAAPGESDSQQANEEQLTSAHTRLLTPDSPLAPYSAHPGFR